MNLIRLVSQKNAFSEEAFLLEKTLGESSMRHDTGELVEVPGKLLSAELVSKFSIPLVERCWLIEDEKEHPVLVELCEAFPIGSSFYYIRVRGL